MFLRFCVLQGAYWSFHAAMPGYLAAYLLASGMKPSTWGVLQAAYLLFALAGSFFWGPWVDRHRASRRFYLMANCAAAVLSVSLFFLARIPAAPFVLYPLLGFMIGPVPTVLDAWVIASFPQNPDAGPRSRSCATLSFAVVMLVMGQLVSRVGYWVMPVVGGAFLAVSVLTALFQQEPERQASAPSSQDGRAPVKELFRSRLYVLLIAAVFFTGMTMAPINNMKVLVFESVGGDVSFLGWDSFIGCLCQVPFLVLSGKLRRIRAEYRLILGAVMAVGYALLIALAVSPAMVIAGTVLTNINFGIMYPTMREMTEKNVDASLRNTAHSVVDVAYGSLAGMISSAWSGAVIQTAGRPAMGSICMGIGLVAIFCTVVIRLFSRRRETCSLAGKKRAAA